MNLKSDLQSSGNLPAPCEFRAATLSVVLLLMATCFPARLFSAPANPGLDPVNQNVRHVDCNSHGTDRGFESIDAALASLNPTQENTIYVEGACRENANISGFEHLQLIARNGASITDASGGTASVVSILESPNVSVQGFTIVGAPYGSIRFPVTLTPSGNAEIDGMDCLHSNCSFSGNTVQAGFDGVFISGGRASFNGDVIENAADCDIFVTNNATVEAVGITLQGGVQGACGAAVAHNAFLWLQDSTVTNNTGDGLEIANSGSANIVHTSITNNGGNGVRLTSHSSLQLSSATLSPNFVGPGSTITGNAGAGVSIQDLSFAVFAPHVSNVVTNNNGGPPGLDVDCEPQFPGTHGALNNTGGGITNCVEP